jgi:hypothetical protein
MASQTETGKGVIIMSCVSISTLDNLRPDIEYLEDWDGVNMVMSKYQIKYTSPDICFELNIMSIDTDGLSIPQELRNRIERFGKMLAAGLPHDVIYGGELFPRNLGDWIFLEIYEYKQLRDRERNPDVADPRLWGWTLRNAAWLAVRCFGGFVWDKHTFDSVAAVRKCTTVVISEVSDKYRKVIQEHEKTMTDKGYPPCIVFNN